MLGYVVVYVAVLLRCRQFDPHLVSALWSELAWWLTEDPHSLARLDLESRCCRTTLATPLTAYPSTRD